jgi:hypothetical protein
MPYWMQWMLRDSNFPLPLDYRRKLLSEKAVARGIDKGFDPIKLSIIKWKRIHEAFARLKGEPFSEGYLNGFKDYLGFKTCALCITSTKKHLNQIGAIRYGSDKCKVCPLSPIDRCTMDGSVFDQIASLVSSRVLGPSDEGENKKILRLIDLTNTMIENLWLALKDSKDRDSSQMEV